MKVEEAKVGMQVYSNAYDEFGTITDIDPSGSGDCEVSFEDGEIRCEKIKDLEYEEDVL